jgi:hypothetical protein
VPKFCHWFEVDTYPVPTRVANIEAIRKKELEAQKKLEE